MHLFCKLNKDKKIRKASTGKIKIAQMITRMDRGGSADIVRGLCEKLDPEKFEVWLVTGPTREPNARTREFLASCRNLSVIATLGREITPWADMVTLARLIRLFRRERFDIVHTHTAKAGVLGRVAAGICGIKAVHTPHGHNFYGYFQSRFLNHCVKLAERFCGIFTSRMIVFTRLEREDYINEKVLDTQKICVIDQGIELPSPTEERDYGVRENVGMIARLEPVKGAEHFVRACRLVSAARPQARFFLVGEGSKRAELEALVRDQGIGDKFIFTGWIERVGEILPELDLLVLPSLNESVGMALIEAQSAGIPVVATRVGGIPEVVRENETGLLVAPGNHEELSAAICRLLSDAGLRRRMGENAAQWVRGKFEVQRMADNFREIYGRLC